VSHSFRYGRLVLPEQRAEEDVRGLRGVVGVTNDIEIKLRVQVAKIRAAFARNSQINADNKSDEWRQSNPYWKRRFLV